MKKIAGAITTLFLLFFPEEIRAATTEMQNQKPTLENVIVLLSYIILVLLIVFACIALIKWLRKMYKAQKK